LADKILTAMNDPSRIADLNRRFAIPSIVEIVNGNGGLPKINIATPAASAQIYLHGAQLTSWQPAGAEQVIFLSEHSRWENGRAIRGGIPVCFPWFRGKPDDPLAPAHGFVRTKQWQLGSITEQDGSVIVELSTESDETARRWWPHEFRLVNRFAVGTTLALELNVANTGSMPFQFEQALHTYFRVGASQQVRVRGLDGVRYLDNTDRNREKVQSGDVTFASATDNAYLDTHAELDVIDPTLHRTIRTDKQNSATTVVWNPWQQGAAALSDLGNEEWQRMTCVEASNILHSAVSLAPGQQHTMRATISVVPFVEASSVRCEFENSIRNL
jgi:glucose-6-phosphate 1-epimerase